MIFEGFARLAFGVIRSLMLVLAVVVLVQYMIEHPVPTERGREAAFPVVFATFILIGREGLRWDR